MKNQMNIQFESCSVNESFARVAVAAFIAPLDPSVQDLYDIKAAVSEAVTNSIIHGYANEEGHEVMIECSYEGNQVCVAVIDKGKGIENVEEAMTTLFTTCEEEERAGLGFTVMQSMMDEVEVYSKLGQGTTVRMKKKLSP